MSKTFKNDVLPIGLSRFLSRSPKNANTHETTSNENQALAAIGRTPKCGHTVWGIHYITIYDNAGAKQKNRNKMMGHKVRWENTSYTH
jgi:hypothetical protein